MTTHTQTPVQRSVGSKDNSGNKRTDRRTQTITLPLPTALKTTTFILPRVRTAFSVNSPSVCIADGLSTSLLVIMQLRRT